MGFPPDFHPCCTADGQPVPCLSAGTFGADCGAFPESCIQCCRQQEGDRITLFSGPDMAFCPSPLESSAFDSGPWTSCRRTRSISDSGFDSSLDSGSDPGSRWSPEGVPWVAPWSDVPWSTPVNTNSSRSPPGSGNHCGFTMPADLHAFTMLAIPRPHASTMPARKRALATAGCGAPKRGCP